MKKLSTCIILLILLFLCGCSFREETADIAATTLPIYEFSCRICDGTGLSVSRLVTESVSCLHDYTLQINQMRMIEGADTVILSGAGLEDFMEDALSASRHIIDASEDIPLHCATHTHGHESSEDQHAHLHESDPHIWLSPTNAKIMSENICEKLSALYPEHADAFRHNLSKLLEDLSSLEEYGHNALSDLQTREIITFHDGFSYLAEEFDIAILEAVEEESGSEASAAELIHLIQIVNAHHLPALFTERNGSTAAASVIAAETGAQCYELDMGLSGDSYFEAMYHNFDTLREALQ